MNNEYFIIQYHIHTYILKDMVYPTTDISNLGSDQFSFKLCQLYILNY